MKAAQTRGPKVNKKPAWYAPYFKDKKITVMGLGVLGRGVGDIAFLAEQGAHLLVTDVKSEEFLAGSLAQLKKFSDIKYRIGKHDKKDFSASAADMILKAASVPLDSEFVLYAQSQKVPIEMSAALMADLVKRRFGDSVTVIGITGTRGKSTTTSLIAHLLKSAGKKVRLAGNVRGVSNLPLLKKIRKGDFIVAELDSWQLQGFGSKGVSPDIAVFTSFLDDHLNYYKGDRELYFNDKAHIFRNLKSEKTDIKSSSNFARNGACAGMLFASPQAAQQIRKRFPKQRMVVGNAGAWADDFKTSLIGEHNMQNIRLAALVAEACGIDRSAIKKALRMASAEPGRLEYLGKIKGRHVYDDNNATSPDAVVAALDSLHKTYQKPHIQLIIGGADKHLDLGRLRKALSTYNPTLTLIGGTGTERLLKEMHAGKSAKSQQAVPRSFDSFNEALESAFAESKGSKAKDRIVILSPGFASFGMFKNEYDREDQFKAFIKKITITSSIKNRRKK